MKIICWNLLNVGRTKLNKAFTPTFSGFGLGNTIGDYIIRLVMGNAVWNNLGISGNPADVFVVIELKTGGKNKGGAVSGTCLPTLTALRDAMNLTVANTAFAANYHYSYATPLITGNHETVGVIFNDRIFNANPTTQVLRDNNGRFITPRTPFMVSLVNTANNQTMNIVGIHAPPVSGGNNQRYRPPIDFARKLGIIDDLDPNNVMGEDFFIMGDFNCDPTSNYINGLGDVIEGFDTLINDWNYATDIPADTLSSLRRRVNNTQAPPANYLSEAYDNLLYNFDNPPNPITEEILDLISHARNFGVNPVQAAYPGNLVALLNNNNRVSDHLPMVLEF